ncbi:MAG: RHS repeat domain-containing protein [Sedimenticola sp.]
MPNKILFSFLVAFMAAWFLCLPYYANSANYDYDELGQLIHYVDDNGQVTTYRYDPAGNILAVDGSGAIPAPVVDSTSSNEIRCGETVQIRVQGSRLEGARLTLSQPGVQVPQVQTALNEVTFMLKVEDCSLIGLQLLSFHTAGDSVGTSITVNPELLEAYVTLALLAIPPGGSQRVFALNLAHADNLPYHFTLSVSDQTVAMLTQTSFVIPAGETEVRGVIAELKASQTFLTLISPTLGTSSLPVFVLVDFAGVNNSYADILEVVKEDYLDPPSITVGHMVAARENAV